MSNELTKLPPQSVAYIGAVHHGSGSFLGTGGNQGKPRPISAHPVESRREFLWRCGGGLGGIALSSLLASEGLLAG